MRNRSPGRGAILLFTLLLSLASAAALLFALSDSFADSLRLFFVVPLASPYYLGTMLAAAAPLIVAALGIAFAFSSRNFNLGGEGQILAGALAATMTALALGDAPPLLVQAASLAAAATAGGLVGLISGFLKRRAGVDELISSFLLSAIVIAAADFLVTGPFQDPASNFQSTRIIAEKYAFAKLLPPSSLSTGILLALALALAGKLAMARSRFGFELKICGSNREFARYAGIDADAYLVLPMALSGALHGVAGALMVFGSQMKTMRGFTGGVGWSAIAVSLIGGNDPLAIVPAALFYAYLETGAKSVTMGSNISFEIVQIVQAAIFLFVTATRLPFSRKRRRAGALS